MKGPCKHAVQQDRSSLASRSFPLGPMQLVKLTLGEVGTRLGLGAGALLRHLARTGSLRAQSCTSCELASRVQEEALQGLYVQAIYKRDRVVRRSDLLLLLRRKDASGRGKIKRRRYEALQTTCAPKYLWQATMIIVQAAAAAPASSPTATGQQKQDTKKSLKATQATSIRGFLQQMFGPKVKTDAQSAWTSLNPEMPCNSSSQQQQPTPALSILPGKSTNRQDTAHTQMLLNGSWAESPRNQPLTLLARPVSSNSSCALLATIGTTYGNGRCCPASAAAAAGNPPKGSMPSACCCC